MYDSALAYRVNPFIFDLKVNLRLFHMNGEFNPKCTKHFSYFVDTTNLYFLPSVKI